jgi:hypothetical protein
LWHARHAAFVLSSDDLPGGGRRGLDVFEEFLDPRAQAGVDVASTSTESIS